jgi:hypothetical protein
MKRAAAAFAGALAVLAPSVALADNLGGAIWLAEALVAAIDVVVTLIAFAPWLIYLVAKRRSSVAATVLIAIGALFELALIIIFRDAIAIVFAALLALKAGLLIASWKRSSDARRH